MAEFIATFADDFSGSEVYKVVGHGLGQSLDLESLMTVLDDLSKPEEELLNSISPHTYRVLRAWDADLVEDQAFKSESAKLLARCKQIIRRECLKSVAERQSEILHTYDGLFGALSKDARNSPSGAGAIDVPTDCWVFTTNYDLCLELWAQQREVEFDRGVVFKFGQEVFDASSFSRPRRIYKLHGSIDMFIKDGQIRALPAFATIDGVLTATGEEYGSEYLFYPIENSGYSHVMTAPYLIMMSAFREALAAAERVVVLGSSLRDRTITSTLDDVLRTQATGSRTPIRLLDPAAEKIVDRLREQGLVSLADAIIPHAQAFPNVDGVSASS